ncbi:dipeptidase PepV [Lacticaseibacillus baoqingensis]|uniref:Dipeptidase PepV n=1 Tax=Lacticaseibacillus baoqingensis TaxID=2486013 RepID=A0ABW4E920_9LACO|nr:dipeptidase PepV [Lacticaseibacillus baoqingensis]
MTINWQALAADYQTDILHDLATLVAIESVRNDDLATPQAPLGEGPAAALKAMLALAKRDGFATKNFDNVVGRIVAGQGPEVIGILGHMDVVPAGPGWDSDPFFLTQKNQRLYGRGTADDKGPTLAAYYALKLLKDQGITLNKRVDFIIGTDEESGWYGMTRYQQTEQLPEYGFSPDAEFPIINGEKGISTLLLTFNATKPALANRQLLSFSSGLRVNMVPQTATAIITGTLPPDWQAVTAAYAKAHHVTIDTTQSVDGQVFTLTGKGAHALEPDAGINAATHLATLLAPWVDDPAGQQYLTTIATYLHDDSRGHRLGIAITDPVMGELTASADLFTYQPDGEQSIAINVRYPQGTDLDVIQRQMQATLDTTATVSIQDPGHTPHYVSAQTPFVQTLLQVFEAHTGQAGHEKVIGGGTYGRILKHGVAFGAMMPGRENVMHQANEYMPLADLIQAVAIYADAIYRLTR